VKYICDTNFILRYLLGDNIKMFEEAKEIFNQAKTGEITLLIEQTVFTEVVFVLSSFYKIPREKIGSILSELLVYKGIKCEREILTLALSYYTKYNLHIVDCILAAKTKITEAQILTFDE
jgi:predicted nucleic-acid-binding protein